MTTYLRQAIIDRRRTIVVRRVSDRKVAGSRFDSRTDNALLCPLRLLPIRAKQSIRCGGPGRPRTCKQNPKKMRCVGDVRPTPVIGLLA